MRPSLLLTPCFALTLLTACADTPTIPLAPDTPHALEVRGAVALEHYGGHVTSPYPNPFLGAPVTLRLADGTTSSATAVVGDFSFQDFHRGAPGGTILALTTLSYGGRTYQVALPLLDHTATCDLLTLQFGPATVPGVGEIEPFVGGVASSELRGNRLCALALLCDAKAAPIAHVQLLNAVAGDFSRGIIAPE